MTTKRKLTFAGMLIAFCLLLCCVFGFLFSTTGGNTAYAYSSSTKYKLDLTATGTSGIYIYVSGATGSGTVSSGAAFNFAPNRVDVVLTKKTELGRYTYTRYVKDFALTGPVTYSSADKQKNSSKSSEKTVTYTLPTLTNGSYTLTMTTGQDYSGMIGDASTKVTFNFIVDKNRPTISGASVSTTGKYTNKAFTVTASDLLSGIDKLYWKAPTASIYSSTTATSKTISVGSTNGRYTFYAVDKAGNQSSYYYVYYDNVVPTGTIKGTSGTLSSGSYTNKAFSYSATDSGSGINYLQYKKPGSSTWTSYTSGTTIPATSTNGWYYFRAYDNAGNVSAESSVCLDTAVPTGTVYRETTSVSSGSSVKGAYIKFVATDSLSGVANCYVKAPGETSYKSYTSNSPLTAEGVYQFYIVDRAGNQSSTYSVALDNTAPTGMVYGGTTEKPSGSIVNSSYIKFIGSDNASGVSAMYVKKPGSSSFISYTKATQRKFTLCGKEIYSKSTQYCGTNEHEKGNGGGDVMELKEFTVDDCLRTMYETPSDGAKSNEGKVCIIPLENLAEEYRRPEYQLFRVSGGFGCIPGGIGRACYGRFCIDGERTMWPKGDFLGVANERVERIAEEMEAAWKDRTVEKNMEM